MTTPTDLHTAAAALGRKGGKRKSERKTAANRDHCNYPPREGKLQRGRPIMKYTVEVKSRSGQTDYYPELSRKEATQTAKNEAKDNNHRVFVTWFRAADGQRGYLNRDGSHAITGEAW